MHQHISRRNINYVSHGFFQAVYRFESVVHTLNKSPKKIEDYSVYTGLDQDLLNTDFQSLLLNKNELVKIQFEISRIVVADMITYLLASEKAQALDVEQYCVLVVITTPLIIQQWNAGIQSGMKLIVKQPVLQDNQVLSICVTRIQNIVLSGINKKIDTPEESRKIAKLLFDRKQFYDALLEYQYALSSPMLLSSNRKRAVLYANSSTCLFELRAYQSSELYAQIAIKIDTQYTKGYAKKIFALLQRKKFQDVPFWLLKLQNKIQQVIQFQKINKKYLTYLVNSIGQFNWNDFFAYQGNPRSQYNFGEYLSPKVSKIQKNSTKTYYAIKQIQPYELIMVRKPLLFLRYEEMKEQNLSVIDFARYIVLEQSIKTSLKQICYCSVKLASHKYLEQLLENFQITNLFFKQNNSKESYAKGKGLGIWPDLFYCSQSCSPNCSFYINRNALFVSSVKIIPAGTPLTIDYAYLAPEKPRKSFLYDSFRIQCSCKICQWVDIPQYLSNPDDSCSSELKNFQNYKLIKKFVWQTKIAQKIFETKLGDDARSQNLQLFIQVIDLDPHWDDISKFIFALRKQKSGKMIRLFRKAIANLIQKFLKIPQEQSIALFDKMI